MSDEVSDSEHEGIGELLLKPIAPVLDVFDDLGATVVLLGKTIT